MSLNIRLLYSAGVAKVRGAFKVLILEVLTLELLR